ncbi:helix-turn-helix domain-containing protein [Streptomyces luteolus]|uniref:Helix-turn-helix transcriptional regulator n=1 Tax=Streptomyces luteolus TaxID=3043615 RepID=A0ABT6SR37_9ACTN|nr:helix-turn-helix transcriptional regulator [Streptomyces sp. B-S-A12]MDI3417856.1 helix-turn-helix transcriptional regulator [Streptomyces sp. B-S-A12]
MSELLDMEGRSGRETLARTLRGLREKAGISLGKLADDTAYDKSYLSRLESGQRFSKLGVMEELDLYYGCGDLLVSRWKAAKREVFKDEFKGFMDLEETARVMWKYTPGIPGLLQSEGFAQEVLSGPQATPEPEGWVEEQVAARLGRQQLLKQEPRPYVRVIIDEYAFRRPTACAEAWVEQLLHIESAARWPNIVIQVLPFKAGLHHYMSDSLTLLWQEDGSAVAYVEGNTSGVLIKDNAGVLNRRLSYDRLRDLALSPSDSLAFMRDVIEEHRS